MVQNQLGQVKLGQVKLGHIRSSQVGTLLGTPFLVAFRLSWRRAQMHTPPPPPSRVLFLTLSPHSRKPTCQASFNSSLWF